MRCTGTPVCSPQPDWAQGRGVCRAQLLWLPYCSALRRTGSLLPDFGVRVTSAGAHSGSLTYLGWSQLWGLVLWPWRSLLSWQEAHERVHPSFHGDGFCDSNFQASVHLGDFLTVSWAPTSGRQDFAPSHSGQRAQGPRFPSDPLFLCRHWRAVSWGRVRGPA